MHKKFDHESIEKKWQDIWKERKLYDVNERDTSKEKEYILVEWPYPSGNLHIGHWFAFAVVDIYARAKRMQGKQVLFPIGFDAFGLPAENAAIKRGLDPKAWTDSNIAFMKTQLESMGNSFSWNMSTSSTDPDYYAWTQWMFTKFFENNIAYRGKGTVNWCPGCNTVIANEQVLGDGTCERSGDVIEKRQMEQWMLRITEYADRLIDDLDALDWPEHIKEAQRQWIGRSEGATLEFEITFDNSEHQNSIIPVFTTRPDTLYGATYLVLSSEHPWITLAIDENHTALNNKDEVLDYVKSARDKSEIERTNATKEKTGVELKGVHAINPATGVKIPVFVGDYVLAGYGTGAIMGVPAHDERDFAFAKKYSIPINQVIVPCIIDSKNPPRPELEEIKRDTVIVHLRDASTGKYALLNWHGTLDGVVTAIMGGIEDGQTPEQAALAEIKEEAGFNDVRIIKESPWITAARYCASHKNQNRLAHTHAFLAEVNQASPNTAVDESEKALHSITWVDEADVEKSLTPLHQKLVWQTLHSDSPLTGTGYLINSGEFDGTDSENAKKKIVLKVNGTFTNTYRLRDWSIGRQRYWGVPIPIVYDTEGKLHIVPKEHLPWHLPTDVDFTPTGVPPLSKSTELKERVERIFGKGWTPEVETIDTFVDSSWYFLRYFDNKNELELSSLEKQKEWMPIDIYFGGAEHTTMHLLYSRFWQKALFDLGLATTEEPYKKRVNRGLVLGPDGNKMSKSKGNVIDPDIQVKQLGADTMKMYLAFMGPYGESTNYPWDMGGIAGLRRFLERMYGLDDHIQESISEDCEKILNKTIRKVTLDIEAYKFNTAISSLMMLLNEVEKNGLDKKTYEIFLILLAPFAPHLSEELWNNLGKESSIHEMVWPVANTALLKDSFTTISVQINGKMRGTIEVPPTSDENSVVEAVKSNVSFSSKIQGEIRKVIYVEGRIINIICTPPQ